MGTILKTLRSLKPVLAGTGLAAGLLAARPGHAQLPGGFGLATDFSSVEYWDDPFGQQIKTRLTGAESRPVPGAEGELEVKQLRVENYNTNGELEAVITAPECIYSANDYTARSAGPIRVETGDGKSLLTGDGFLWRQNEKWLTISNQVNTIISDDRVSTLKKP